MLDKQAFLFVPRRPDSVPLIDGYRVAILWAIPMILLRVQDGEQTAGNLRFFFLLVFRFHFFDLGDHRHLVLN